MRNWRAARNRFRRLVFAGNVFDKQVVGPTHGDPTARRVAMVLAEKPQVVLREPFVLDDLSLVEFGGSS